MYIYQKKIVLQKHNTNLPEDEIWTDSLGNSFICPGVTVKLHEQHANW